MLIGISGRKASGKSTAAQLLFDQGFKRASFAAGLKEYLAKLYHWQEEDLMTQSGKEAVLEKPAVWDKEACRALEKLSNVQIDFEELRQFKTRREAMQYVGTDVLRKQHPDFHINEFKRRFANGNFVCDDLRFLNEVEVLEDMKATCCYIMRPYYWDYSNHASEVSLLRKHFKNVFINDSSLQSLIGECELFFKQGNKKIPEHNNYDKFQQFNEETAYWAGVFVGNGKIKYKKKVGLKVNGNQDLLDQLEKFVAPCKCTRKKNSCFIESPYLIEDLKLWRIEPEEKRMPDIDHSLMYHWIKGFASGNKQPNYIKMQGNVSLISDVATFLNVEGCVISRERGICNIWNLEYFDDKATTVYAKLGKPT